MNEEIKQDEKKESSETADVLTLLRRMQQQLTFMEKKLDALMNGPSAPSARRFEERKFSKPFRRFDHSERREGRERHRDFGDRPFQERSGEREERSGETGGGFRHSKKPFFKRNKKRHHGGR